MVSRKYVILLLLFTICFNQGFIQAQKVNQAIRGFTETEFMTTFKDMKLEAESTVISFKAEQRSYDQDDVNNVKDAYDKTAREFNNVLYRIRDDFTDRRKLKFINEYPEDYTRGLKGEMQSLKDFYADNFQKTMLEVTDEHSFVTIILDVFRAAKEVTSYIRSIKKSARQFKEEQLQEQLVDPFRFKLWHEIGKGKESTYYNDDDYNSGYDDYEEDYNDEEYDYEEDEYGGSKIKGKKAKEEKKKPTKVKIDIPTGKSTKDKETIPSKKTKKKNN